MSQMEVFSGMIKRLDAALPGAVLKAGVAFGELIVETDPAHLCVLLTTLRDTEAFSELVDVCGVDWPEREKRFDVVYHLLSITRNQRVRIKLACGDDEHVPTATAIYPAANWFERETYDMFGIVFDGHPDLRRILTDYEFEGHPLRKDFPLTGYVEAVYDDEQKKVVYQPVHLAQDYRNFDFASPWEGTQSGRRD